MEKGISLATKIIEKSLDESTMLDIKMLSKEAKSYPIQEIDFKSELGKLLSNLQEDHLLTIKGYTGLNSKKINAILRNNWNYEEHGKKTIEEEQKIRNDISIIDEIISNFPPNNNAFITYRGTTLQSFKKYGINSLEDLKDLNNKFLYEEGYTSTSLMEEQSYYNKEIYGKINNVEIRYIIPPNSNDGIPLNSSELSYSPNQQEYLIERNSLSKVIDVKIEESSAVITVVLIPKTIWNKQEKADVKEVTK